MIVNLRILSFVLVLVCNLRKVLPQDLCYGELCFTLHESKLNFQDAKASCQSTSSKLLAVTDNATQYRLSAYLSYLKKNSTYYIDIEGQEALENTWYLVNGSIFYGAVIGQDNRASLYKLYGSLSVDSNIWLMVASNPNWNQHYICEFNETKCPQYQENGRVYNGRCYVRFETVNLTWFVARKECISSDGDLATFNCPNDRCFLQYEVPFNTSWLNPALSYWTGILYKNRSWITPSGSDNEIVYTQWSNGTPNNYNYMCVCLDPNGNPPWSWTDCDCSQQMSYICLQRVPTPITTLTQMEKISSTTSSSRMVAADSTAISSDKATQEGKASLAIGLGIGIGGAFLILVIAVVVVLIIRRRKGSQMKQVQKPSNFSSADNLANSHYEGLHQEHQLSATDARIYQELRPQESRGAIIDETVDYELVRNQT